MLKQMHPFWCFEHEEEIKLEDIKDHVKICDWFKTYYKKTISML
jgi:hypothetical protein